MDSQHKQCEDEGENRNKIGWNSFQAACHLLVTKYNNEEAAKRNQADIIGILIG